MIYSYRLHAVVVVLVTFAIMVAATRDDSEWSPIQTRSGPVPFSPEFFGQHSDAHHPETIRTIAHIRSRMLTRSHRAHAESSPFASSPKIASVDSGDSQ
jgi:hypothetical protein